MLELSELEPLAIINREIVFEEFSTYVITLRYLNITDERTDKQPTMA